MILLYSVENSFSLLFIEEMNFFPFACMESATKSCVVFLCFCLLLKFS